MKTRFARFSRRPEIVLSFAFAGMIAFYLSTASMFT